MDNNPFFDMVKEWTVRDYQTQSIKSEVIIDMLISGFIGEMIAAQEGCEKAMLLAKEFPIHTEKDDEGEKTENGGNLRNAKVDYLVAAGKSLYLVELKTTKESYNENQKTRMVQVEKKGNKKLWAFFFRVIASKCRRKSELDSIKYMKTWKRIQKEAKIPLEDESEPSEEMCKALGVENLKQQDDKTKICNDFRFLSEQFSGIKIAYICLKEDEKLSDVLRVNLEDLIYGKGEICQRFNKKLKSSDKYKAWYYVRKILDGCIKCFEGRNLMDLDKFDAEVREIYDLLHGRKQEEFPAIAGSSHYKALFDSAQENGPEDFIEFLSDFECLAYELLGGRDEKAPFVGKEMEELPKLVLQELQTDCSK